MSALTVTSLRRCCNNPTKYVELINVIFPCYLSFAMYGGEFINGNIRLQNIDLWKDVWKCYISLSWSMIPTSWNEFIALPIWHNNESNFFCDKRYVEKGILLINDLFNKNGIFLTFAEFLNEYEVQTNFL